jgi:alkylation response protein AidB-like acyl-CoA dehydrogenase
MSTDTQIADEIVDTIRRWVDKEVIPNASELEHADEFPQAMFEQMNEFGLFGATIDEEYGGLGLDVRTYARIIEELSRGWMSLSGILNTHKIGATMISRYGTDEQKQRFLPDMVKGNEVWCQLFSEPDAGSDLAGLKMSAVKDGDDWVINGQKIWTTGAQFCKWGMLVARTDTNVAKHAGLTYFIVDMEAPGIEIRPIKQMNGGSGFNEVFFGDVRTPDSNRLGGVGDGWRVAITTLMNERSSIGSSLGGGGTINDLIKLAQKVELDGRSAIEDGGVRRAIADFAVKRSGLKYTGQRGLSALSHGQTPGPEASIGKLIAAVMGQEMGAFGMELQGSAGVLSDEDSLLDPVWQNTYLAMPGLRLAGGTDEILRNIIAERVLGMPGEPRMDKGKAFKDIPTGR